MDTSDFLGVWGDESDESYAVSSSLDQSNVQVLYSNATNGGVNGDDRHNGNPVLTLLGLLAIMFTYTHVLESYFAARQSHRSSPAVAAWEADYERRCYDLFCDLQSPDFSYDPLYAFISRDPVMREIIVPSFRDRVVHHCIDSIIRPLLENIYIHDVYAGRVGRGVHFGIRRAEYFLRSCSHNYARPVWSLRLDIRAFFRSISWDILEGILRERKYNNSDNLTPDPSPNRRGEGMQIYGSIQRLLKKHIYRDYSLVHRNTQKWGDFPISKSLFSAPLWYGLPLGDLVSQHLANLYLTPLDHFVKHTLKIGYYGRYMDDMVFFHESREVLETVEEQVKIFLSERLGLTLHPDKIQLRSSDEGCDFLGRRILPYRTYVGPRIKHGFIESATFADIPHARFQSFLGLLGHHDTHALMTHAGVFEQ